MERNGKCKGFFLSETNKGYFKVIFKNNNELNNIFLYNLDLVLSDKLLKKIISRI